MDCLIKEDLVSWLFDGEPRTVTVSDIDQATYSNDHNAITVLSGPDQNTKKIIVFEPNGDLRCEVHQPKETFFHGLGANRGHDVAIFSNIYHIGWKTWWLGIDTEIGDVVSLVEGR